MQNEAHHVCAGQFPLRFFTLRLISMSLVSFGLAENESGETETETETRLGKRMAYEERVESLCQPIQAATSLLPKQSMNEPTYPFIHPSIHPSIHSPTH